MNIANYSVNNRVVIWVAVFFSLVGGIFSYTKLAKLEDAEFTLKTALVITQYTGASPHEVELEVTDVIEQAVQATKGLDFIESESKEGLSIVTVEIKGSKKTHEMPQIWDDLRRKVNDCRPYLPRTAYPMVLDDFGDVYGVFLSLSGEGYSYAELHDYSAMLKRELLMVKGVAKVKLFGTKTESIEINLLSSRMASFGINPGQVIGILNDLNSRWDNGQIEVDGQRIKIRDRSSFKTVEEVGDLVIQDYSNQQIKLKDIAEIKEAYQQPVKNLMRFNGKESIGLGLSMSWGVNVMNVGADIDKRLAELKGQLPIGMNIEKVYFQSDEVAESNSLFMTNLAESVAIVVVILLLFMGIRSGLLIGSGLILTILATFIVMLAGDIALQRTSLAAIIVAMGMLVDNAIVVTDGALVALQRGHSRRKSALLGAETTIWPLFGATLIAILAFLPIYMAPGSVGEICKSMFQVLAISLGLSWLFAVTQNVLFSDSFLKVNKSAMNKEPFSGKGYKIFEKLLMKVLSHRFISLTVVLLVLVGSLMVFGKVKKPFFVELTKPLVTVNYWLPEGSDIKEVESDLKEIEQFVMKIDHVKSVTTAIGESLPRYILMAEVVKNNSSYGQLLVRTDEFDNLDEVREAIDTYIKENYPSANVHLKLLLGGPPLEFKIEARFMGPDPAVLHNLADQAKDIMRNEKLATNVRDDWRQKVMTWEPVYNQEKGRRANVSRQQMSTALQAANDGAIVGRFYDGDQAQSILLKVVDDTRDQNNQLQYLPVWGGGASATILDQVLDGSQMAWEDPVIRRYNRRRSITAQCDPISSDITGDQLLAELKDKIEAIPLPEGYYLMWDGEHRKQVEGNENVGAFFPLAIILMMIIIVILFNSFRQTMIIFLMLPLSFIGVANGLFVFDKAFGFMAIVGFLGLLGMVIKNAVVLIDQINVLIKEKSPIEAVVESAISRMRPVMMAALTTILGMIPLINDAMYGSMAATIMFGLLFATILTLFVVPLFFCLFYKIKIVD